MDPRTERTLQSEGDLTARCAGVRQSSAGGVRATGLPHWGRCQGAVGRRPLLKVLGSSIQHVGPIGAGSLAKLTTNTLLGVQVDTIAELIEMLQRQGVDPKQILDAVASTQVWSTFAGRIAASMLNGTFAPQFPIELIEKDFSYTVHTAGGGENAPAITAIRNIFRKALSEGLGELNMTAIVKLFEGNKD